MQQVSIKALRLGKTLTEDRIRVAAHKAAIPKHMKHHTLRHSFAARVVEDGYDISTVQELLGHKDVRITMIHTHLLNKGGHGVRSPVARL